jgi:hypothetical protein
VDDRAVTRLSGGQEAVVDGPRFDALTRLIGTTRSRREVLRSALGGTALGIGGILLVQSADTKAKNKGKRKRKRKKARVCLDAGDACTNSAECCPDTTKRICEGLRNAGHSGRECCGGVGAECGGKDGEDDIPPFCCKNFGCNKITKVCQSLPPE